MLAVLSCPCSSGISSLAFSIGASYASRVEGQPYFPFPPSIFAFGSAALRSQRPGGGGAIDGNLPVYKDDAASTLRSMPGVATIPKPSLTWTPVVLWIKCPSNLTRLPRHFERFVLVFHFSLPLCLPAQRPIISIAFEGSVALVESLSR